VQYGLDERTVEVAYAFRRSGPEVQVDGAPVGAVVLHSAGDGVVDLELDGVRRRLTVSTHGGTVYVDSDLGATRLEQLDRFPEPGAGLAAGSLTAPMPGTVVRVDAVAGGQVVAGALLLVLEAMKMEHLVRAPRDGVVDEVHVTPGEQVDAGALLVVLRDA
jgi:propionyl-CoA carboxylase alpha chain